MLCGLNQAAKVTYERKIEPQLLEHFRRVAQAPTLKDATDPTRLIALVGGHSRIRFSW
jgi:hypothetical protein